MEIKKRSLRNLKGLFSRKMKLLNHENDFLIRGKIILILILIFLIENFLLVFLIEKIQFWFQYGYFNWAKKLFLF